MLPSPAFWLRSAAIDSALSRGSSSRSSTPKPGAKRTMVAHASPATRTTAAMVTRRRQMLRSSRGARSGIAVFLVTRLAVAAGVVLFLGDVHAAVGFGKQFLGGGT